MTGDKFKFQISFVAFEDGSYDHAKHIGDESSHRLFIMFVLGRTIPKKVEFSGLRACV